MEGHLSPYLLLSSSSSLHPPVSLSSKHWLAGWLTSWQSAIFLRRRRIRSLQNVEQISGVIPLPTPIQHRSSDGGLPSLPLALPRHNVYHPRGVGTPVYHFFALQAFSGTGLILGQWDGNKKRRDITSTPTKGSQNVYVQGRPNSSGEIVKTGFKATNEDERKSTTPAERCKNCRSPSLFLVCLVGSCA